MRLTIEQQRDLVFDADFEIEVIGLGGCDPLCDAGYWCRNCDGDPDDEFEQDGE